MQSKKKITILRFFLLVVAVSISVSDYIAQAKCPDPPRYFKGSDTFGGRFKRFTYLTMCMNSIYFTFSFIVDFLPRSKTSRLFADWLFTTICWMMSWVTVIIFWVLFLIDREFIYPSYLEEYLPAYGLMNHGWHVLPLVLVTLECLLIEHAHPRPLHVALTVFSVGASYTAWVVVLYYVNGTWVYPFMRFLTPVTFGIFIALTSLAGGFFYWIGKELARLSGKIKTSKLKK